MAPITPPPRNAMTLVSLTPFRLKTGSIPTSVKLCLVAPPDEDLQNELAGATIEEDLLLTGNNHFVLYLFRSFQDFQRGADVPALSKLKDGGRQLYDTNSNYWQPIYLPYILRSSPDSQSTARGGRQHGRKTTSVSRISRSKNQKRMLTITRTLDDPNRNSVTETEQIVYLPKPGLEEGKVATWLNHITTALRSLAPSFRGMNTRSHTRTLADTQRLWSAKFATKPAPADVKMKMKPDIALLRKDPFDPNGPNSWRNIVSFIELSSTQEFSGIAKQVTRKSYVIYTAQPGRCFVVALSIFQLYFCLHLFDHSGAIQSRAYSIHSCAQYLVRVLYMLAFALEELIGYDPTLFYSSVVPRATLLHANPTVQVCNETFIITHLLFNSDMIRGRATLCLAVRSASGKLYIVKISWAHQGWATTKEQMLN
jgi:hypothetical protein